MAEKGPKILFLSQNIYFPENKICRVKNILILSTRALLGRPLHPPPQCVKLLDFPGRLTIQGDYYCEFMVS